MSDITLKQFLLCETQDVPSQSEPSHLEILSNNPRNAIEQLARSRADVITLSNNDVAPNLDQALITKFWNSKDDVWHVGQSADPLDLMRFIIPGTLYRTIPSPTCDGVINWRIDFRGMLIKPSIIANLGGFDPVFDTISGMAWEFGWRCLTRGGIVRQMPSLSDDKLNPLYPSLSDYYRLVFKYYGARMARIVGIRRILQKAYVRKELKAINAALHSSLNVTEPPIGAAHRDITSVQVPNNPNVSVVLPTFGRYPYVAEVLEDLRNQTIAPTQIIVADGNHERMPEAYEQFTDLPIEVIWLQPEENGTCKSRNACLLKATGDYVWFVDDDSRLAANNLENHLRVMEVYGADVSVGPAYMRERPELHGFQREISCTFMDCGTTLVRSSLLQKVGGFDVQFNEYLAGEDGEIGDRFIKSGALMLNNPFAKRFHYLAPIGGARSSNNNLHRWKRWSLKPRPVQSVYYRAKMHLDSASAREALLLSWFTAGWRRRPGEKRTLSWLARTAMFEFLALPLSIIRLIRSKRMAEQMLREGPMVPSLARKEKR